MLLQLDHLVIAVPDPEAAAIQLERFVGLRCTGGGQHPQWGTYNRLAWLGDTYIELIGVADRALAPSGVVSRAVLAAIETRRSGLVTYAIASDDVAADGARLRASGSPIGEPEVRSRTRPDGEVVSWKAIYAELGPAEPPFIIEHEYVGAEWGDAAREKRASLPHPVGGPARVRGIELPVPDVITASMAYAATTGLYLDAMSRTVHLGEQYVRLVPGRPLRDPAIVEIDVQPARTGLVPTRSVDALGVRWRISG
jgi:Glyoxalase-like domain